MCDDSWPAKKLEYRGGGIFFYREAGMRPVPASIGVCSATREASFAVAPAPTFVARTATAQPGHKNAPALLPGRLASGVEPRPPIRYWPRPSPRRMARIRSG
jgi:hypothetical protein